MAHLNKWITLASVLFIGAAGYGLYEAFGKDVSSTFNNPRIPLFNTLFATEFVDPTPVEEEKEPEVEIEVAVALEKEEEREEEQERLVEPEIVNVKEEEKVPEVEEEKEPTPTIIYKTEVENPAPKIQEITQEEPTEVVTETVVKIEVVVEEEEKKTEITKAEQTRPSIDTADENTVLVSSDKDVLASSVQEIESPFPNLDESESSSARPTEDEDTAAASQITTALQGEDESFVKTLWSNSIAVRWRDKLLLSGTEDPAWDKKAEKANEVLKTRDIWVRGWSWWQKGTTITRDDVIYICRDAIARTPWGTWWSFRYKLYWDLTWYFCSKPNTAKPKNWWYYTEATKDKMDEEQAKKSKG